jgi:hypothetical protein
VFSFGYGQRPNITKVVQGPGPAAYDKLDQVSFHFQR